MELKRLPDTELEVMKALWQSKEPAPRAWLEERLAPHGWATNTVNTYLSRLVDKGYLSCDRRGKTNYYAPLVTRSAYQEFEGRSVLNKLFGASVKDFVAALAGSDGLKRDELDELSAYLDELKEGRGK